MISEGFTDKQHAYEQLTCEICDAAVPRSEMYCNDPICEKSCGCSVRMCFQQCMRSYISMKIRDGAKLICPGMVEGRRCNASVERSLLTRLFSDECPLCNSKNVPLLNVGCSLAHSFCELCLRTMALDQINSRKMLPCCPLATECKFQYDLPIMTMVLKGAENLEEHLSEWYELQVKKLVQCNPLYKPCPAAGCEGVIKKSKSAPLSEQGTNSFCDSCGQQFCWRCAGPVHPHDTCLDVQNITARWFGFVERMSKEPTIGAASGGAGLQTTFKNLFASVGSIMESNEYFRSNITSGNIKACPKCNKVVQKLEGCDSMVCGKDYHGVNILFQSFSNLIYLIFIIFRAMFKTDVDIVFHGRLYHNYHKNTHHAFSCKLPVFQS
jgi:hypothetical protein